MRTGTIFPILWILAGVSTSQAAQQPCSSDVLWRTSDGNSHCPVEYCSGGWNRTGLPAKEQKICLDWDSQHPPKLYKAKPGEKLETLLPNCPVGGGLSCNDDRFQKVWKRVVSNTGEVTMIDMNSITHLENGTTNVSAWRSGDLGTTLLWFDCRGHMRTFLGMDASPVMNAPPRSVGGVIAKIVCK